jgi:hypothetical protein
MSETAWPAHSIRPYESLWMLVQRFAWLNRPNATQLAEAMGISVPQLMHLDLTFARCSRRQMGLEPLRVLLEATPQQWSYATLDATITGAGIDHLIRFCPICLQNGYHTVWRQLIFPVTDNHNSR